MIADNVQATYEDTSSLVLARHPEWLVDAILSGKSCPSEAVVITGFWRSGKTWLLEALSRSLDAKAVFEPLHPDTTGYSRIPSKHYHGSEEAISGFMPFAPCHLAGEPGLKRHLIRSLTGVARGVFVRRARFSIRKTEGRNYSWYIAALKERLADALRSRVVISRALI
jgi:hypothetical protein